MESKKDFFDKIFKLLGAVDVHEMNQLYQIAKDNFEPRWTPVEERLPEKKKNVLLRCWCESLKKFVHHEGYLSDDGFCFWTGETIRPSPDGYSVKSWQDLPEPPEA